jgi:mannose-6-phosphate isomerase-like protein (cupin superfamily)
MTMNVNKELFESGLLELYVLGQTTPEETKEIQELAQSDKSVYKEIFEIELSLEKYAEAHAIEPNPIIKPFLIATLDFSDRMQSGEIPLFAPMLTSDSKIEDFDVWLNRDDMTIPQDFDDFHAKILSLTPEAVTALVWIKEIAPQEVHDDQYERFLIIEGTCDITIGTDVHQLVAGDYLTIPLHTTHHIIVTSSNPCKVILQRVAA